MKIVVTGALGHIGSRLIRALPRAFPGATILLLDNLLTQRYCSLFDLPDGATYRFIENDILKTDLEPLIAGSVVVIHLAAITDAANSFERPDAVENVNFVGTQKVADACRKTGVPLIFFSSTSVYGSQSALVDESCGEEELKPQSPYAESKLRSETWLAKQSGLRHTVLRFGTIFGVSPGIRFHTAVNKFIWQAVTGQPISVWRTALHQKRPYLDLEDGVAAICHVIVKDLFDGQIYNVVTENYTVSEIVEAIRARIPTLAVELVDNKIMNQLSYEVSADKFAETGFTRSGNLGTGIDSTINILAGLRS